MSVRLSQQLLARTDVYGARVDCRGDSTARSAPGAWPCLYSCDSEDCWGSGAAGLTALCRGAVFVAPFFTAPQGQCCVSSLDVAVGQVGGHKRKYAVMMQSSRVGVKVSMLSLLLGALFLSLCSWCLGLDFRGRPSWGASRPHGRKDSLWFRGGRVTSVGQVRLAIWLSIMR
jgi:hypothetical protein